MNRRSGIVLCMLVFCALLSGCGCGKKSEKDPAQEQVLEITITPAVTPTLSPSEIDPDAVVTNGSVTMVNEYLAGQGGSGEEE